MLSPLGARVALPAAPAAEVLYNGITLGSPWPPRLNYPNEHPVRPPYLTDPPAVVPIDVGRQLFVDDFLIEKTTLNRAHHRPTYHPANPVLRPETPWERRDEYSERTRTPANPTAMPFSDGVFFDPRDRLFKMWYMAGYSMTTCLATSEDGITWRRPTFDVVAGTNIVDAGQRDSNTVWLDQLETDPRKRYKMAIWHDHALMLYVSPDGVHWTTIGNSGRTADRSTFFQNPFRNVWAFSLRADQSAMQVSSRYRKYWEAPRFETAINWNAVAPVSWVKADSLDRPRPGIAAAAELYTLDCVAYESLLLGLFSVWRGESDVREKINEITVGYSRDGFHWHRPDRQTFLPVSEEPGQWNWANVQSAGGCCLVVNDRLYFYVSGREGRPGTNSPGVCSTGMAILRRDGFVSMDWDPAARVVRGDGQSDTGTLTTRPVRFSGGHLFVNADAAGGELRVEILDQQDRTLEPFSAARCVPIEGDGTRQQVRWDAGTLKNLAGQAVRFRFHVRRRGRLYAFWVSPSPSGESRGYPAAGGPEFSGPIDSRGA